MKHGIVLVNIGTPASTAAADVKAYLRSFLSDKRVIKKQGLLWKLVLHGIILPRRTPKAAKRYEAIWTPEGSPLLRYAEAQQAHLQAMMPDAVVAFAMSYSRPTIPEVLDAMLARGVTRLTVVPLFPQYSGTTVGSIFDSVVGYFAETDRVIDVRFAASYHTHPAYINYYSERIARAVRPEKPDVILFSYHSIPTAYVDAGDRYPKECEETSRRIVAPFPEIPHFTCYQSRFVRHGWLDPKTGDVLKTLPGKGLRKVLVAAPGFLADNLETLLELDVEARDAFLQAGGESFTYIPAFNGEVALAHILHSVATERF